MKLKKIAVIAALTSVLSACISTTKVGSGPVKMGDSMQLTLGKAWNQVNANGLNGPHRDTWTLEGLPVDTLMVYSGVNDGEIIHPERASQNDKKNFIFKSTMNAEQIVALFQGDLTRDGSTFELLKLEPSVFGGSKGYHFEFRILRKTDNLEVLGNADMSVIKGKLYALVYQAPKLTFYPSHIESVRQVAQSVKIAS